MFDAYKSIQQQIGNNRVLLLLPLSFSPSHLYCGVCFLVLTLGWMLHCPRTFTRANFNINQTCACSDCVLPCGIVREDLLHSPRSYHFNTSFITYWPFTRIHFRNSFCQKRNRILTIFTILLDFFASKLLSAF